jgi:hypothetical protein
MKKMIFCFLAFFVLIAFVAHADGDAPRTNADTPHADGDAPRLEETEKSVISPKKGILSLGAGFSYTNNPEFFGGHFEFGINLYRNIFFVQNKFLLRAGGFKTDGLDNTAITLSDKLAFGRYSEDIIGMYIYIEGGAGFFGNAQKDFSKDTLIYNFGFGGGLEFGDFDFGGLYVEVGYIGQKMASSYPLSGVLVQTGWRISLQK